MSSFCVCVGRDRGRFAFQALQNVKYKAAPLSLVRTA